MLIDMILVCMLAALLFLGGWDSPFGGLGVLAQWTSFVPGFLWLTLKVGLLLFCMLWSRATLPRYRYDQVMSIGWKCLIPVAIFWIVVVSLLMEYQVI